MVVRSIRVSAIPRARALLLSAWVPLAGCASVDATPTESLQRAFPEQAGQILDAGRELVASHGGFVAAESGLREELRAVLPREGNDAIRLELAGGHEIRVRALGAWGEGTLEDGAVAYRRAGGLSFWTAARHGIEEWLLLEAPAVRRGAPIAAWEIDGGDVREEDGAIVIADAAGVDRLHVTAPAAYAAGGRPVEAALSAVGSRIELAVAAEGEAVLVDPLWIPTPDLSTPRRRHAAATLPGGRVLVIGGFGPNSTVLATTQIYDPASAAWVSSPAPASLANRRRELTATALSDGVLVVGGENGSTTVASCEVYDATLNAWSSVGALVPDRYRHAAATLPPSGKVLVAGGYRDGESLSHAAVYDPGTRVWSSGTAPLHQARELHTATTLRSGLVLVVGGTLTVGDDTLYSLTSAETYDPTTNTWTEREPSNAVHNQHTATLLSDGRVLVVGGPSTGPAEIYDPIANTWTPAGTLAEAPDRYRHTATLLDNNCVVIAGGQTGPSSNPIYLDDVELWDPATNTWTPTLQLSPPRSRHTATLLSDGTVLFTGGEGRNMAGNLDALDVVDRFALSAAGAACTIGCECATGFCVDGVCCDTACDTGVCGACSVAAGATADGTCTALTGTPCDDRDACTSGEVCRSGACSGGTAVVCEATGPCQQPGLCDPATGLCSTVPANDGDTCDDGNPCTERDACRDGACQGDPPRTCPPLDACHIEGTCEPATGECVPINAPPGTPCEGGSCIDGRCVPDGAPVAPDEGFVTPVTPREEPAGCDCRAAGAPPAGDRTAPVALLGAALAAGASRRRRRAARNHHPRDRQ